jgi:hypothetical protein
VALASAVEGRVPPGELMTSLTHIQVGDLVTHVEQPNAVGLVLKGPLRLVSDASFTDYSVVVPWLSDPPAGDWWEVSWAAAPVAKIGTAHDAMGVYHKSALTCIVRLQTDA